MPAYPWADTWPGEPEGICAVVLLQWHECVGSSAFSDSNAKGIPTKMRCVRGFSILIYSATCMGCPCSAVHDAPPHTYPRHGGSLHHTTSSGSRCGVGRRPQLRSTNDLWQWEQKHRSHLFMLFLFSSIFSSQIQCIFYPSNKGKCTSQLLGCFMKRGYRNALIHINIVFEYCLGFDTVLPPKQLMPQFDTKMLVVNLRHMMLRLLKHTDLIWHSHQLEVDNHIKFSYFFKMVYFFCVTKTTLSRHKKSRRSS